MYRSNYTPERQQPLWLLILILVVLIGLMLYVTRNDPEPYDEGQAVAAEVVASQSAYERRKASEDRMAKKLAAAYAQGRADAEKDGCRATPALTKPLR